MIGWYITGGILGLILLLLLLPIRIKLQYEEELYLWIGYAFFNSMSDLSFLNVKVVFEIWFH